MAARSDRQVKRLGIVALVVLLLLLAGSFNLQKLPGFRGATYYAELTDASGLRVGSTVQVAGIHVGRVNDITIGPEMVIAEFDVKGITLGEDTRAAVEVKSLLGDKFLSLTSRGGGTMPEGDTIPLARTDVTFDIVQTLGQLTTQTEQTNRENLTAALDSLAETLDAATPEIRSSLGGLSALSETIASRDAELEELLARSRNVTGLLDERKGDLVQLMENANLVFAELRQRKEAINALLVNADQLAVQLRGVVDDNREQLAPTLAQLDDVLSFLQEREDQVEELLRNYGPYVNILGNVVGSGPWFGAYVPNIIGVFSGEFVPGPAGGTR
ncbi:virulence factor Mce family protein [Aeromicrobium marinum DSM 15272]|uniref:Virulence factor Mce family protein n=1 Tax=Aeromicrobium marinum DSM 15272 TaxID=585531 RepID=E2SEJ8_9ACTN|nr:MCE family protein [Aeromicrobium marinum]EFQ82295.1 virulence factor Mce family protein [Aeromicrobium marinum DSM 15272]